MENLGPFHFFFTLSCADARYEENFTSLLEGHTIVYNMINGRERAFVIVDDVEIIMDDFIKVNLSKHEMIKNNILNATRNFNHRIKTFIKNIIMSKNGDMCVEYYNYRVEFQLRGAGHIHGVLWIDVDRFLERQTSADNNLFEELKNAFASVNNYQIPSVKECKALEDFADMFISCTLKSPGGQKAKDVNCHHHTFTCKKRGPKCRFFLLDSLKLKQSSVFL